MRCHVSGPLDEVPEVVALRQVEGRNIAVGGDVKEEEEAAAAAEGEEEEEEAGQPKPDAVGIGLVRKRKPQTAKA